MLILTPMLKALVDGSAPLPPPHPQKLSFPNEFRAMFEIANMVEVLIGNEGRELSDIERRHLLFKLASWCSKKGKVQPEAIRLELKAIYDIVNYNLVMYPEWVTSQWGVSLAKRRFNQYQNAALKLARAVAVAPPRVFTFKRPAGYRLVELTNGAQIHAEGRALGHCMSWSINLDVMRQRGYPPNGDPEALECLTYAVKVRSGELRIFSLRDRRGIPIATIGYDTREKTIRRMEGATGRPRIWDVNKCGIIHALSNVVEIKGVMMMNFCDESCPQRGWCRRLNFGLGRYAVVRD
ncbi:hypothetical protein [Hyphomicrobium sp.]|jgi:hypothetical protein|uniref:hypothetical protein n=1 Tax=Hyphomicrobium sp. TaxID=82 RepID=UPI00356AA04E